MEDSQPQQATPAEIKNTPHVARPDQNKQKHHKRGGEKPQTLSDQKKSGENKTDGELKHTEQRVDLPPDKDAAISGGITSMRTEGRTVEMPVHDPAPFKEKIIGKTDEPSDDIIAQASNATPVVIPVHFNKREVELSKDLLDHGVEEGVDTSKPKIEIIQHAGILERSETNAEPFGSSERVKLPFSYTLGEQVEKQAKIRDSVKWLAKEVIKQWSRFRPETIQTFMAGKRTRTKIITLMVLAGVGLVFIGIIGLVWDKYQNQ
jgi:hypothetical protein